MGKSTSPYPALVVGSDGSGVVSQAGALLLVGTARRTGLIKGLSVALAPWRRPMASHDPGKVVLDLAISIAIGGDCAADLAALRCEPGVFGHVASDPTVSRLVAGLADNAPQALAAIAAARAQARAMAWKLAGHIAPDHDLSATRPLIIDLDSSLLDAHSDKEQARPTWKRGFGFHPLCSFIDHGAAGTGEPGVLELRAGNAGANTASDHKRVLAATLAQLPWRPGHRVGQKILVRTDAGGGTHEFLAYCHSRRLQYSVGFTLTDTMAGAVDRVPKHVWTPAYNSDGEPRDGAWVTEITGLLDLGGWPPGIRVIVRKERPHLGAQLRFTDRDGMRLIAFATNTRTGQLADLELRHRHRARCEDRIRAAKDTGMTNLPYHRFDANRVWLALVALALDLTAWMQMLALTGHDAQRWEPKALRLRLLPIPARLARHARRVHLRLSTHNPWTDLAVTAWSRLQPE